jgi:sec-independent protein translocase protein TatB
VRSVSDPTTKWKDFVPGSETGRLSEERAKNAKKMHDAMAERAQQRIDAEKAEQEAGKAEQKPAAAEKPAAAKKPATKKPAAKKPAPAKKPAAKKTPATPKKPAAKKAAPKSGKVT